MHPAARGGRMKQQGVVNIHGKNYKTVALRVNEFREKHPIEEGWGITTHMVTATEEIVIIRAVISTPQGVEVATGYAEEVRTSSKINRTSAMENCETSAIGRALAAAGYGGEEYASANEVQGAIEQQKRGVSTADSYVVSREKLKSALDALNITAEQVHQALGGRPPQRWTNANLEAFVKKFKNEEDFRKKIEGASILSPG